MAFNALVLKESNNVVNGAIVSAVTAQGVACAEIVSQNLSRDGLLIMNRDASLDIAVTFIPNPSGFPNASTPTTAQAYATRILRIAANSSELIEVKAETRVLISAASGTPAFAWQEVDA
jgi:hypothetical protein